MASQIQFGGIPSLSNGRGHGENESSVESDSVERLLNELTHANVKPLWAQMARYNPPLPNPKAIPFIWRYEDVHPYLIRAGKMVTEKQAERRVLMLVNPSMDAPFTTDTLYAGLQLVMPNETAPAHRHTAFAMRFIIEGQGGFTAVHGKRIKMKRGDVILTPTWNWHDHGNDHSGPMIWLDGLDLPNFVHFPVHFVEHYQSPRYPAENIDTSASPLVFPWDKMQAALDIEGRSWVQKRYLQADGSEVSKVLGGQAERLSTGSSSTTRQETSSCVYHVISGSGRSVIEEKTIDWKQGDTFCIPSWQTYQHTASADGTVYLYRFDDQPMLKSLGFYRTEATDPSSLVSN